MAQHTRRTVLRGAAVAAAGMTVAAATPGVAFARSDDLETPPDRSPGATDGSLVAYVKDVSTGEIHLMGRDSVVVVTDRRLAARLAHLAG